MGDDPICKHVRLLASPRVANNQYLKEIVKFIDWQSEFLQFLQLTVVGISSGVFRYSCSSFANKSLRWAIYSCMFIRQNE